jgi:hypothetical protein
MCVTMCFALPASQGCPSDPRSCAGHTMWSNAAKLSACSPGDMARQVTRGRVCDFSTFESQTTEGDPDETGWSSLPGLHSCDYRSQCLAVCRGTFQPMLHCKMTCSVTGQLCSGRYHACCLTQQETQASIPVLPPNSCGLPQCILVNRRETPKQKFAHSVSVSSIPTSVSIIVDPQPSGKRPAPSMRRQDVYAKSCPCYCHLLVDNIHRKFPAVKATIWVICRCPRLIIFRVQPLSVMASVYMSNRWANS